MVVLGKYSKVGAGVTGSIVGALLLGALCYTGYNWYTAYGKYKEMIKRAHNTIISSVVDKDNEALNRNCAEFMKIKADIEHDPRMMNMFNDFVGSLNTVPADKRMTRQYEINNMCNNAASVALYLKDLNTSFDKNKPYNEYLKSALEL